MSDGDASLGQVLTSIGYLRDDIYRWLDAGQERMDRHEKQITTNTAEIASIRRDLASVPAPRASAESVNSWVRLVSALSDVAKEWGETLKLWGRIGRWLLLAYLAFTLNRGEFVNIVKDVVMHGQERSE